MIHQLVLAAYGQPEAAGFILRGIKGIFVAIGSVIAAIMQRNHRCNEGPQPIWLGDPRTVLQHLHANRGGCDPVQEVKGLLRLSWTCGLTNVDGTGSGDSVQSV